MMPYFKVYLDERMALSQVPDVANAILNADNTNIVGVGLVVEEREYDPWTSAVKWSGKNPNAGVGG